MTEIIRNRQVPVEDPGTLQPWSLDERYPAEPGAYEMQKQIGSGQTAAVWAARVRGTGESVAVKVFNIQYLQGDKGRAVSEVLTQRAIRHPNILPGLAYFDTGDSLYSVMPFVNGGAVSDILAHRHPDGLSQAAALAVANPVLKALEHMHHHGIMHRDIKAANVLVDDKGHVYVADFGVVAPVEILSGRTSAGGEDRARVMARHKAAMSDFVGTPAWMAPEVVNANEEEGYDERADIWSFGILLMEMAHGEVPHCSEKNLGDIVMAITNDAPPEFKAPTDGRQFTQDFGRLIAKCLQKNPADRATATELLQDPIFQGLLSEQKLVHALFSRGEEESHHNLQRGLSHASSYSRMPTHSKDMKQKSLDALLQEEVDNVLVILAKAAKPAKLLCNRGLEDSSSSSDDSTPKEERHSRFNRHHRAHPSERLTNKDLTTCKGLIFGRAHKHGGIIRSSAKGTGFAMARLENDEGETYWTAPSFVQVFGSGAGIAVGAEELSFILVLHDVDHLMEAASSKAAMKTNVSASTKHHKVSLQLRLGNGVHTTKLLSFSEGRMFDMTILGWDIEPDGELNERVYGNDANPETILGGHQRPPHDFDRLVDELLHLERGGLPEMHTQSQKNISVAPQLGPLQKTSSGSSLGGSSVLQQPQAAQPQAVQHQASTGSPLGVRNATPSAPVPQQPQAVQPHASAGAPLEVRTAASSSPASPMALSSSGGVSPHGVQPQASTEPPLVVRTAASSSPFSPMALNSGGSSPQQLQVVQPQVSTGSPTGVRTAAFSSSMLPAALNSGGSSSPQPRVVRSVSSTGSPVGIRTDVQQPQAMQAQSSGGSSIRVSTDGQQPQAMQPETPGGPPIRMPSTDGQQQQQAMQPQSSDGSLVGVHAGPMQPRTSGGPLIRVITDGQQSQAMQQQTSGGSPLTVSTDGQQPQAMQPQSSGGPPIRISTDGQQQQQ